MEKMMQKRNVLVRKAQLNDLKEIQKLFVETIKEICKKHYTANQIEAWTLDAVQDTDQLRWEEALNNQYFLVAQQAEIIVGFSSLENGNHIDFLYVHKDHQREGVADKLYSEIESEAIRQSQAVLTSDVSITAQPFFEKVGFEVMEEQAAIRHGVELTNFKMMKTIE